MRPPTLRTVPEKRQNAKNASRIRKHMPRHDDVDMLAVVSPCVERWLAVCL